MITHRVEDGRCIAESTVTGVIGDGDSQLDACMCLLEALELQIEVKLEYEHLGNLARGRRTAEMEQLREDNVAADRRAAARERRAWLWVGMAVGAAVVLTVWEVMR